MNLLYYSEENSLLNNTSVCSIMTYTSDLSNGMARYCLFMSQTKVFWLSPGAYGFFLCCMLCVWVLCSILMMSCTSVLCALSVPKGKREQSIFHHRQKIFPTASTDENISSFYLIIPLLIIIWSLFGLLFTIYHPVPYL